MNSRKPILGLVLILTIASVVNAQARRVDKPFPDDLYQVYVDRTKIIETALENSKDECGGIYFQGDHHPTVLMLEAEAGFLVTSSNHTFAPSWINYGKVKLSGNTFNLYPQLKSEDPNAHKIQLELKCIAWDTQHFLVPSDELLKFAMAVHSRSEFELGSFFAKGDVRESGRRGLPIVEKAYRSIMSMPAVNATVTDASPPGDYSQKVAINVGSSHNVAVGMVFFRLLKYGQIVIRIDKVSANRSEGEAFKFVSFEGDRDLNVQKGMRFTSKMPKGFSEPG